MTLKMKTAELQPAATGRLAVPQTAEKLHGQMRICYIASAIEVPCRAGLGSGGSTHTHEVGRTLAEMGDVVHLLCRRASPEHAERERLGNMEVHRRFGWESAPGRILKRHAVLWKLARVPYYLLHTLLDTVWIARLGRRERFHVIYERSSSATLAGTCASWLLGIPLILEINDEGYRPVSLRLARKIVTPDPDAIRPGVRHKVAALEWGANTRWFHPSITGTGVRRRYGIERRDVILFAGSGLPWHGLREIIKAAPLVVRKADNPLFLIVGTGPEISACRQMVVASGLAEWFRFAGAVEYAEVPAYIAACDIALAPYTSQLAQNRRHRFASPLKVFEYMAGGKPVIVTRVANTRGIIEDSVTGLVIPEDSPDALAAAILRLLGEPELRERLGKHARAAAETKFSWEKHCCELRAIFLAAAQPNRKDQAPSSPKHESKRAQPCKSPSTSK